MKTTNRYLFTLFMAAALEHFAWAGDAPYVDLALGDAEMERCLIAWYNGTPPPRATQLDIAARLAAASPNGKVDICEGYLRDLRQSFICPNDHDTPTLDASIDASGEVHTWMYIYKGMDAPELSERFPEPLRMFGRLWSGYMLGKMEYPHILDQLGRISPVMEALGVQMMDNSLGHQFYMSPAIVRGNFAAEPDRMQLEAELARRSSRLFSAQAETRARQWYETIENQDLPTLRAMVGTSLLRRDFILEKAPAERPADAPQGTLPQKFGGVQGVEGSVDLGDGYVLDKVLHDWMNPDARPPKGSRSAYEMTQGYVTMADSVYQAAQTSGKNVSDPDRMVVWPGYFFRFITHVQAKDFDEEELVLAYAPGAGLWKVYSWRHN